MHDPRTFRLNDTGVSLESGLIDLILFDILFLFAQKGYFLLHHLVEEVTTLFVLHAVTKCLIGKPLLVGN